MAQKVASPTCARCASHGSVAWIVARNAAIRALCPRRLPPGFDPARWQRQAVSHDRRPSRVFLGVSLCDEEPGVEQWRPFTSKDIDFQGGREDVLRIAKELGPGATPWFTRDDSLGRCCSLSGRRLTDDGGGSAAYPRGAVRARWRNWRQNTSLPDIGCGWPIPFHCLPANYTSRSKWTKRNAGTWSTCVSCSCASVRSSAKHCVGWKPAHCRRAVGWELWNECSSWQSPVAARKPSERWGWTGRRRSR